MKSGKLNVMVCGAKSGRGIAILKALLQSPTLAGLGLKVFPVDITPFAVGLHVHTHQKGAVLPRLEDDPQAWERFIQEHDIDVVFPASDLDLSALAQVRDGWQQVEGCKVMVDDETTVSIANDKQQTFVALHHAEVKTPESYSRKPGLLAFAQFYGYPLVVKPRFGANSRGFQIVRSDEELEFFWSLTPLPMAQQYIEGNEYSGAITYDKAGNAAAFFVTRVYERRGHMTLGEVGYYPEAFAALQDFALKTRHLRFGHALNVQMIERDGEFFVIELNAVCSGSTAVRAAFGFNQPEQLIMHHCYGLRVAEPILANTGVVMTFTEELYLFNTTYDDLKASTIGERGNIRQWL